MISANSGGATQGAALMDGFQAAIGVVTAISALGLIAALTGTRLLRARQPELALATAQAEQEALPEREAA